MQGIVQTICLMYSMGVSQQKGDLPQTLMHMEAHPIRASKKHHAHYGDLGCEHILAIQVRGNSTARMVVFYNDTPFVRVGVHPATINEMDKLSDFGGDGEYQGLLTTIFADVEMHPLVCPYPRTPGKRKS